MNETSVASRSGDLFEEVKAQPIPIDEVSKKVMPTDRVSQHLTPGGEASEETFLHDEIPR